MKGDNPQDLAQRRKQLKRIEIWLASFIKKAYPHPFNIAGITNDVRLGGPT